MRPWQEKGTWRSDKAQQKTPAACYAAGVTFFASKTVSRVLYLTAIYLGAPLPARSSHPGSGRAGLYAPIPVLLRIEFTASDASAPTGALLPHLSTLTSLAQALPPSPRRKAAELVRFAAPPLPTKTAFLREPHFVTGEAVYLCCTFPEVAFGGRYPLSLPCGARTFLMDGLSACPRGCLSYSQIDYTGKSRTCQPEAVSRSQSERADSSSGR